MTLSAFCNYDENSRPRRSRDNVRRDADFQYTTYIRSNDDGSTNFVAIEYCTKLAHHRFRSDCYAFRLWTVEQGGTSVARYTPVHSASTEAHTELIAQIEALGFTVIATSNDAFNSFIDAGASAWDVRDITGTAPAPVQFLHA